MSSACEGRNTGSVTIKQPSVSTKTTTKEGKTLNSTMTTHSSSLKSCRDSASGPLARRHGCRVDDGGALERDRTLGEEESRGARSSEEVNHGLSEDDFLPN